MENRSFANKALDAINLDNIVHHKSVKAMVPPYFKDQSLPIISYSYSSSIAPKILKINVYCRTSALKYSPACHVITEYLSVIHNEILRKILAKGPKYGRPQSINWKMS
jgi:hypothetical protein